VNRAGLQSDIEAMRAVLRTRKAKKLSKKAKAVVSRWLERSVEALEHRDATGAVG